MSEKLEELKEESFGILSSGGIRLSSILDWSPACQLLISMGDISSNILESIGTGGSISGCLGITGSLGISGL